MKKLFLVALLSTVFAIMGCQQKNESTPPSNTEPTSSTAQPSNSSNDNTGN